MGVRNKNSRLYRTRIHGCKEQEFKIVENENALV